MPTYDYECQKCGHNFELFQGINDQPRSRCPKCRGKVRRLIGNGIGIVFKGSGFYVTDSRKKTKTPGKTSKPQSSSDSASTPTKKESGSSATDKSNSPKVKTA